ncbi:glutaredoxin family protein [Pseudoalteromonas sp. JC3]|uniref:glutaredoxin family protein n=1 Tax=Pseudoalteromonas sp. JC3 TaxID=2810196 RepID=UPI0019D0B63D|nr:glutaredoxin family protein [Pseudoalteromonas sp. JC3]MBR8841831.1 glutaredoxin family protein [Pseudoalteromonas sp. JC3]WJE11171.1 glutaredoxin family protein [Pseudoalteromonas sp. JC3]
MNIKSAIIYITTVFFGIVCGIISFKIYSWAVEPPPYIEIETSAHFAKTENKVVIYTTSWCQHCKRLKKFLKEYNVKFSERDIEKTSEENKSLYRSLNLKGVPQVVIGNKVISGFNEALIRIELSKNKI